MKIREAMTVASCYSAMISVRDLIATGDVPEELVDSFGDVLEIVEQAIRDCRWYIAPILREEDCEDE